MTDKTSEKARRPIPSNPPRWAPNPDPASISVPGLDTTAPVHDQIEQIEQLITIKLQNIDENFSKIHNLLADKLLPAVKRYSVGTEPVRDAAKFWTSFYEQAAQIRIPTFDDYETVNENTTSEREDTESTEDSYPVSDSHISDIGGHEPSMATTENSFMPGQQAYSSTPATDRLERAYNTSDDQSGGGPSWASSIESPFVRLDREIRSLTREDSLLGSPEQSASSVLLEDADTTADQTFKAEHSQTHSSSSKGKNKENSKLFRNVLRQNLFSIDSIPEETIKAVSPLKFKGKTKTPIPKNLNPYLPESVKPEKWNGVVDLTNATPRGLKGKAKSLHLSAPGQDSHDDDSFDGLPVGMSPPVLMSPARPPRKSTVLGRTPGREASARISNDLVREIQQKSAQARRMFGYPLGGAAESSVTSSTLPTPPSLSRYNRNGTDTTDSMITDPSLDSLMRRVGLSLGEPVLEPEPRNEDDSFDSLDNSGADLDVGLGQPLMPLQLSTEQDSDSDSLDEINNTAHPSAAFLMASQGRGADDSFGSSNHSDDSLIAEEAANAGIALVHPFARSVEGDAFEDSDSFDDDSMVVGGGEFQEETVFGVPPAERLRAEQLRAASVSQGQLKLAGQDLLEDTIGYGAQLARAGRTEETPTPAYQWDQRQS
ncbi:hypothetical protein JOM56_006700 [Amanita muscaria]